MPQEQMARPASGWQQLLASWPLETSLVTWTFGGDATVLADYATTTLKQLTGMAQFTELTLHQLNFYRHSQKHLTVEQTNIIKKPVRWWLVCWSLCVFIGRIWVFEILNSCSLSQIDLVLLIDSSGFCYHIWWQLCVVLSCALCSNLVHNF